MFRKAEPKNNLLSYVSTDFVCLGDLKSPSRATKGWQQENGGNVAESDESVGGYVLLQFIELLLCISQGYGPSGNTPHLPLCPCLQTPSFLITTYLVLTFLTIALFFYSSYSVFDSFCVFLSVHLCIVYSCSLSLSSSSSATAAAARVSSSFIPWPRRGHFDLFFPEPAYNGS